MSDTRRAMLLMFAFVVLWAAIEGIAAQVLRHYSPYQVVWTRYGVHLALMLAVWGWRQPRQLWHTRRPGFQVARSLLMVGMPASWAIGVQFGMSMDAVMSIFWLSPLMIIALSSIFLRERVSPLLWALSIAACSGSVLLLAPEHFGPLHLLVFPLCMALSFSLYVVMTRSLRTETTTSNLFYSALGVFVVLTPFMPGVWSTPGPVDLAVMALVGVLGYGALWLLDRMASTAPVSVSAPFAYLQIALTVCLAVLAGLDHHHSLRRAALALLLIVGAAAWLWLREPRTPVDRTPPPRAIT